MTASHLIKMGEIDTLIGRASILSINGKRFLTFPSIIDRQDPNALKNHYSTLEWPRHKDLDQICDFPHGPALPGLILLSLERQFSQITDTVHTKPRPIRHFLNNVLAGLAASILMSKT